MLPLLEGTRILDLTQAWAGPFAAALLADLGAEVVKIEGITRIDTMRGHHFLDLDDPGGPVYERAAPFAAANRNKRGCAIELKDPRGREAFLRLVEHSDAVIESFSPRVMPKLGLDHPTLAEHNPRIVLCSLSGFGQSGPWRDYVSYAPVGEALAGVTSLTGYDGEPPMIHGVSSSDPHAGLVTAYELLLALAEARRSGCGRVVDVAQIESSVLFVADAFMTAVLAQREPRRGTDVDGSSAPQGVFPTSDEFGWITISVRDDREWQALAGVLDAPQWVADPAMCTHARRRSRLLEVNALVAERTREHAKDALMAALQEVGVPAAAVRDPKEQLGDPQLAASGFFQHVDHPVAGTHPYPSLPATVDGQRWPIRQTGPTFGQDNAWALREIGGLTEEEIAELVDAGVVATLPAPAQQRLKL